MDENVTGEDEDQVDKRPSLFEIDHLEIKCNLSDSLCEPSLFLGTRFVGFSFFLSFWDLMSFDFLLEVSWKFQQVSVILSEERVHHFILWGDFMLRPRVFFLMVFRFSVTLSSLFEG